jgi:hypothetical protein
VGSLGIELFVRSLLCRLLHLLLGGSQVLLLS